MLLTGWGSQMSSVVPAECASFGSVSHGVPTNGTLVGYKLQQAKKLQIFWHSVVNLSGTVALARWTADIEEINLQIFLKCMYAAVASI